MAETTRRSRSRKGVSSDEPTNARAGTIRTRLAQVVWLVAVVCAMFLAVGALLVALGDSINDSNALVELVLTGADRVDLDLFARSGEGIFSFEGKDSGVKNALVNWGLGAVAYLAVGRIVDRIIRP